MCARQGLEERGGALCRVLRMVRVSANPDAFPCPAFGSGLRVVGVDFHFDDFNDLFDGQICLRATDSNAGDGDIAYGIFDPG